MAELVKIDPHALGVGLYQHDVAGKELARELDEAVRSAVAAAGVNLNTASASLLSRVPGFNARVAADVVARRDTHGAFRRRAELLDVRGIGPKTFQQAAGFLRVDDAADGLERTGVHPESADVARAAVAAALELANDAKTMSWNEVVVIDDGDVDGDVDDDVVIVRETTRRRRRSRRRRSRPTRKERAEGGIEPARVDHLGGGYTPRETGRASSSRR